MKRYATLKKKIVRGKKDLRKAIYTRTRLKSKFITNPSKVNKGTIKRQHNKCVPIRESSIKQYFSNITSMGIVTNREFWKTIKPFLTNKCCFNNSYIMLSYYHVNKYLGKLCNEHYINLFRTVQWLEN